MFFSFYAKKLCVWEGNDCKGPWGPREHHISNILMRIARELTTHPLWNSSTVPVEGGFWHQIIAVVTVDIALCWHWMAPFCDFLCMQKYSEKGNITLKTSWSTDLWSVLLCCSHHPAKTCCPIGFNRTLRFLRMIGSYLFQEFKICFQSGLVGALARQIKHTTTEIVIFILYWYYGNSTEITSWHFQYLAAKFEVEVWWGGGKSKPKMF